MAKASLRQLRENYELGRYESSGNMKDWSFGNLLKKSNILHFCNMLLLAKMIIYCIIDIQPNG